MKQKLLTGLFTLLSVGMCSEMCAQSESGALTDLTSFIQNPDAAAETGWVIDKGTGNTNTTSGQHYSGDAGARYFDSWNPTVGALNYNATQTVAELPNGTYTLKFSGRSSGTKGAFVYVVTGNDTLWIEMKINAIPTLDEAGDTVITYAGDKGGSIWENAEEGSAEKAVNGGNGYGWNMYEIPDIQVADNNLTIGITTDSLVSDVSFDGNWFSVVDFELYGSFSATELLEDYREQCLEYVAWLESEGHEDVSQLLLDDYAGTHTVDTTSVTDVLSEANRLRLLLDQYKTVVETPVSSFNFTTTVTIDDWHVALDENNYVARVNRYSGTDVDVIVPESFTYNNQEYITVGLGDYTGYDYNLGVVYTWNPSIESVVLPVLLRFLGDYSFYGCNKITDISIHSLVESIGDYAIYDCENLRYLYCKAISAPVCSSGFNATKLRTIYVPAGSGASYRSASYWKNYIIVDGEGVSVTVNVETPGTMGDLILAQTENLSDVNYLTVTGSLNDDDIYNIKSRMPDLLSIDLSGIDMTALPDKMFYQRYALQQVVLPAGLTSIGQYAFYGCYDLQDVELPATLKSIGTYAFKNCDNIKHVIIPEGVTTVGSNAFEYCDALQTVKWASTATAVNNSMFYYSSVRNVEIPEGVTSIGWNVFSDTNLKTLECPSTLRSIGGNAFYACDSLAIVTLNEGLESLGENAFYNCDALTEVVLPSTLFDCYMSFNDCNNLKTIKCLALLPPYSYDYNPLYNVDKEDCTLYVPAWTINKYKQTVGWDEFPIIKPLENYWPEYIKPNQDFALTLPDTLPADYKPIFVGGYNKEDDHYAALTVNGNGTFSIKEFSLSYDVEWEARCNGSYITHNTLVNNVTMRADSVFLWVEIKNDKWSFLSFPFDVKVSDILPTQANTNYVIRKYSGKDRADANFSNTWQDMTEDSILHAGEGYIWQSSRYDDAGNSQSTSAFIVSAVNNTNKNLIFANSARTVALNEYQSEFSHNRSWNLIGNPYPCYYDTRAMDFTAPITVWNMYKNTYYAYSPVDDEYILRPGEAFFVQRPVDQEGITFSTVGRQTDRTVRDVTPVTGARSMAAPRQVFNLYLNQDSLSDCTRFVINADAEVAYETNRDASKFMSSDANVPQLFTMEGDVRFAINERPMGEGIIRLGATFGNEGTYTLSLGTTASVEVVLVDKLTGKDVDLNEDDYTFSAEAGTDLNRFEVRFNGLASTDVESHFTQKTTVTAVGGQIVVNGGEVTNIAVYTADGKLVGTATDACAAFKVANGFYVVKVQGKSYKVAVTR